MATTITKQLAPLFSRRMVWASLLLVIVVLLSIIWWRSEDHDSYQRLVINQQVFQVEVADTEVERIQGLSGRSELGSDGMLFVFDQPVRPGFWMKEMQFDLDFVWIKDNQVVEIMSNVPHPAADVPLNQLPTYQPSVLVDAMLEVPAGFAAQQGIAVGDEIRLEYE